VTKRVHVKIYECWLKCGDAEPMFGSSLVDICARDNSNVPEFLVSCFSQIEQRGNQTSASSQSQHLSNHSLTET